MAQDRTFVIDGFAFHTLQDARDAQKEAEGVQYLKDKIAGQDPEKVLELYHKMLDEQVFSTPVGLMFERDLSEDLRNQPELAEYEIRPVDVYPVVPENITEKERDRLQKEHAKENRTKDNRIRFSVILNIVLVALVIGMFFIVSTSNNVNIINYENALIDKYEDWQNALEAREAELDAREEAYNGQN